MLSAKRKALWFSVALIAVSALFVVNAAASTEGFLRPLRDGRAEFPFDRPLSRNLVALSVGVGAIDDADEPARVEGATVTVSRLTDAGPVEVDSQTTDEKGHALFHLKPGPYNVDVVWGSFSANQSLRLHEATRLSLLFDDDGTPHWGATAQRAAEKRGDGAMLVVRVAERSEGERAAPVEGAVVRVYRPATDQTERVLVNESTTGPRGAAAFNLHRGVYVVEVTHEGRNSTQRVPVCGLTNDYVVFGADGSSVAKSDNSCQKPARTDTPPAKTGSGRQVYAPSERRTQAR